MKYNMMKKKNQVKKRLDLIDELAKIKIEMMDEINCEHKWDQKR